MLFLLSLEAKTEELVKRRCGFLCKSIVSITFSFALDENIREINKEKELDLRYFEPLGRRASGFYLSSAFFVFSIFKKDSKMEKLAFELLEVNILSDFSVNLLQNGFGRERPKKSEGNPHKFFKGGNSFPSSHSLHSWAIANTLVQHYEKYKFLIFAFPFLTSLSRVLDDYHWTSDVVSGAIFGIILSNLVHKLNEKYSKFLFYPIINKETKALALRISI